MTQEDQEAGGFDPGNYPALLEFLPAYLHEDFAEEYGDAAKAFAALIADAAGGEIQDVKEEWAALRREFSGRTLQQWHRALRQFGAAWQPQSEQELQAVDEILSRAEA